MQPIFTVHASEFLVANQIQRMFKNKLNLWVPAKDTGIDLLATDPVNKKSVSLQVKFSRNYLTPNFAAKFQDSLRSCGWWTFDERKIESSPADYWVLLIVGVDHPSIDYVVVKPKKLLSALRTLRPTAKRLQSYLWVTKQSMCWETLGLQEDEKKKVASGRFRSAARNFTPFLNEWAPLKRLAKEGAAK